VASLQAQLHQQRRFDNHPEPHAEQEEDELRAQPQGQSGHQQEPIEEVGADAQPEPADGRPCRQEWHQGAAELGEVAVAAFAVAGQAAQHDLVQGPGQLRAQAAH
jgi:hypothetical protein